MVQRHRCFSMCDSSGSAAPRFDCRFADMAPAAYNRMMLQEDSAGLACADGGFHIDPWGAVDRAVITHAHGDHARPGSSAYLCADPSAALLRRRFGADARIESVPYGQAVTLGSIRVSFHPAGHVLG